MGVIGLVVRMSSMVIDGNGSSMATSIENTKQNTGNDCDQENVVDFTILSSIWISVILNTATGVCVLSALIVGWGIVKYRVRIQNWFYDIRWNVFGNIPSISVVTTIRGTDAE